MADISGADIRTTLVVLTIVFGFIITTLTLINALRKEKERSSQPMNEAKTQLADHEKRLVKLESAATTNVTENRLMMRMQLALVRHAIDGNNVEGLRDMREEVQNYLVNK